MNKYQAHVEKGLCLAYTPNGLCPDKGKIPCAVKSTTGAPMQVPLCLFHACAKAVNKMLTGMRAARLARQIK